MKLTEEGAWKTMKIVEIVIDEKGSLCSILNVKCTIQNVDSTEYPQLIRFMIVDCGYHLYTVWEFILLIFSSYTVLPPQSSWT